MSKLSFDKIINILIGVVFICCLPSHFVGAEGETEDEGPAHETVTGNYVLERPTWPPEKPLETPTPEQV